MSAPIDVATVLQSRRLLRKIVEGSRLRIGSRALFLGDLAACDIVSGALDALGVDCTVAGAIGGDTEIAAGFQLVLAINDPGATSGTLLQMSEALRTGGRLMILEAPAKAVPDSISAGLSKAGFDIRSQGIDKRRESWSLLTAKPAKPVGKIKLAPQAA